VNDYGLRKGSQAINKGCGRGVAKDINSKTRKLNVLGLGAFECFPVKSQ
jgi:hypothetical protein